uniref:Pectinesterase n=1 Tax=Anthurium amnicola TaxID=1678845 RepID=A0A1D1XFK7_9ARAE
MDYGRIGRTKSDLSASDVPPPTQDPSSGNNDGSAGSSRRRRRRQRFLLLGLLAALFLVACGVSVAFLARTRGRTSALRKTSEAISRACGLTRYPALCVASLVDFPGAMDAGEDDLVHISVNMTLQRVGRALYDASAIANVPMEALARSAYRDCLELLDDSAHHLARSLAAVFPGAGGQGVPTPEVASDADVLTWLSGALTNQDTCEEGLGGVAAGYVKEQMAAYLQDLAELVSNSLALFAARRSGDFSGIPIQNRRRRRLLGGGDDDDDGLFPAWTTREERRLLEAPATTMQADMVVSKDGSGYRTVGEAVKAAPENSDRRIIIYIKAGRYEENVKVGRKKKNLMFIGDGKGKTIITGYRSVSGSFTTFHTATFAATGAGFIARDITFENTAGPARHQAVALRVGADHAVVYRCAVAGYQDTLYVHSLRQFFRECDIYGTVDFVFGNAAVVLQNCSLYARKPLPTQKNTITAQNRKDPNQNTGISIHASRLLPTPDLAAANSQFPTYLGRPWKLFARTVFLLCYMGDHIAPPGWLEWNGNFALDTLYYGEYMNYGPGAGLAKRVDWPGHRDITLPEEASKFTVAQFISGSDWLPSTGVSFVAGLKF